MTRSRLLLFALALATAPSWARDDAFVPDAEPPMPSSVRDAEPWREEILQLPAWPKDADLVWFAVDGDGRGFRYAIDGSSLAIGSDEVVRYTLVAESASGARNLSFEGLRCTPVGQYRIYAYGTAGRFTQLPRSDWQRIAKGGAEPYRYDLWRSYLCVHLKFAPRPRDEMLRALRRGRLSPLEGTGFMAD